MIFKTFNNDIDKISAKWGILGKSFYDFVDIANKRKIKIDDLITYHGMSLEEAKNEVGSLWRNLFPSKKDLQIDIDSLIPEFDTDSARLALEELQNIQAEINRTKGSWDDYHDKFKDGKEYLLDYAKTNNVLESSVDDVKQANQAARDAAIAHNAALKQQTLSAKAGQVALKGLAMAGNMLVMFAVTKGIELAVKALDDYIHRLDRAKEALETTESELSSVSDQIKENETRIKELETLGTPSIVDKEDLEQLKAQNEELAIRQKYLEQQKQEDARKVADIAKEQYGVKYSSSATREDINKYKELYENPQRSNAPASSYLTGSSTAISSPYAASQQDSGMVKYSDNLADLIAQYEYFEEQKKKAIQAGDSQEIDKWNKKLEETATKLREDRAEIQGFADDLSATGESSPALDDALYKLGLIDDTLLTKGENLVNFINSDAIGEDKDKLVELANSGKLTADVLASEFSEVDKYLKENGLTIEDLISVVRTYKDELESTNETPILNIESFKSQLSEIQSGYQSLIDAKQEFDDNGGFLNPNTIASLTESGLIQYLEQTANGLSINTEAYLKNADAMKANAIQALYDGMCHDVEAIAIGNTGDVSNIAKTAIENVGAAAKQSGTDASNAANGWFALGATVDYAKSKMSDEVQGATGTTKKEIDNTIKAYQNLARMVNNIDITKTTRPKSSSGSKVKDTSKEAEQAAKEAQQKIKEYLDAYINYMDKALDANKITYTQYCNEVSAKLSEMYKDGKISAQDYFSYQEKMLNKQLSFYQSALKGITAILDDEIDKIDDSIDALNKKNDALNKQKDNMDKILSVVNNVYDKEIDKLEKQKDLLQDKIDAINDENDALDLQKRKQEALYALERAQQQRTKKVKYMPTATVM